MCIADVFVNATLALFVAVFVLSIQISTVSQKSYNLHLCLLLLALDTVFVVGRSSHYDDQVFSLATLISSKLIYNSVGTIDEKSIQKLSFVGNLCKILGENTKMAEKEGSNELSLASSC